MTDWSLGLAPALQVCHQFCPAGTAGADNIHCRMQLQHVRSNTVAVVLVGWAGVCVCWCLVCQALQLLCSHSALMGLIGHVHTISHAVACGLCNFDTHAEPHALGWQASPRILWSGASCC